VYYLGVRARNKAGLWGPWASTDGISVGAGANTATVSYASGMQNDAVIKVALGGMAAGGARIVDGDLEVRRASYYRGELGSWSGWLEVGQSGGDLVSSDYAAERGMAYQFRYRIKSEYNVWSNWAEPGTTVRINAAPVAVGGTDASAETGKKVVFDGTRSWDPDGDGIVSYSWDFGDGKADAKGSTTHAYKKAGTYIVTLTVSDGNLNGSATQAVRVRSPEAVSTPGSGGAFALLALGAAMAAFVWRRRKNA
jgi:MYXO-CTERM domain-containing protein